MRSKTLKALSIAMLLVAIFYLPVHTEEAEQPTPDIPKPYPKPDFSKDRPYKVVEIIDGDTIEIVGYEPNEKTSLRLFGADTPETKHPNKPVQLYGKEASAFTKNLLSGEYVYLRFVLEDGKPKRGTYGRILADVYRAPDGLSVNFELVRQGYARVDTEFSAPHKTLLLHLAYKARQARRGLWGFEKYLRKDYTVDPAWEDITVYVTQTGAKYHTDSCKLRGGKDWLEVTLAEAEFDYDPCQVCKPPH